MHQPVRTRNAVQNSPVNGFTLIEILIVLMIVAFLMATLGVTISNMLASAKEAQTIATIEKIDGLIAERQQGLERVFFRGRDFKRYVEKFHEKLLEGNQQRHLFRNYSVCHPKRSKLALVKISSD
jgi:prepilin-type N-terminal cleavage/methylation domain-containing protein